MTLQLRELDHPSEIASLIPTFRVSFTNPGTNLWPLVSGDYRPEPSHQEASLQDLTQRLTAQHQADPTCHWLSVVDQSSGLVVGGGLWRVFDRTNPYDGYSGAEATWFPEGQPRKLASSLLSQFFGTSARLMNKHHVCECVPLVELTLSST